MSTPLEPKAKTNSVAIDHQGNARVERVWVRESWEGFIFGASGGIVDGTQSLLQDSKLYHGKEAKHQIQTGYENRNEKTAT